MGLQGWFSAGLLAAVVAVGTAVGIGGFLLTAPSTAPMLTIPECIVSQQAGFDPWTGLPHGTTIECAHPTGVGNAEATTTQAFATPDAIAGRRALPVPVGFAVGALLVVVVWAANARWRRRSLLPARGQP